MTYLHPAFGTLVVLVAIWAASRGLRARRTVPDASAARAVHRRLTPWVLAGVLLAAVAGTLSAALLRDDLDPARSWHFRAGWGLAALVVAGWWTSRRFTGRPSLRSIHSIHAVLGVGTLLTAVITLLLGLGLLP